MLQRRLIARIGHELVAWDAATAVRGEDGCCITETAGSGVVSWKVVAWRQVRAESGTRRGKVVINLLWDIDVFYDPKASMRGTSST